jgi:hypothetical protein
VSAKLYEGDADGAYRQDSFTAPNFSANTLLSGVGLASSLLSFKNQQYFILGGGNSIYTQFNNAAPSGQAHIGATFHSLTLGPDRGVYGLDTANKLVWKLQTGGLVNYTTTPFSGTVSSNDWNLVIGPDGNAYTDDSASVVKSVSTGGNAATVTLPAPGGNVGLIQALFDSKSGYLDAYYDDGNHAGVEYIFRISN